MCKDINGGFVKPLTAEEIKERVLCDLSVADMYPATISMSTDTVEEVFDNLNKEENNAPSSAEEEWIWINGYKATDENMACRGYQYELGKQFDMPEGEKIEECENGFHLCRDLEDVFNYYCIGSGNRYFEVRALVRKSDYEAYKESKPVDMAFPRRSGKSMWNGRAVAMAVASYRGKDKLVAKSIIFERELTTEEIFEHIEHDNYTSEEMDLALKRGMGYIHDYRKTKELVNLGYSEELSKYFVKNYKYSAAKAVASQPGLSMDTKIIAIFSEHD